MKFRKVHEALIHSPEGLAGPVQILKSLLRPRTLLLLEGPVGAGKTETVKALTMSLGISEIASPSFAIHHHYVGPSRALSVDHVDLYRLESEDDLESTGFWDLFATEEGVVVIEWADRLSSDSLPLNWWKVKMILELTDRPTDRKVSIWVQE